MHPAPLRPRGAVDPLSVAVAVAGLLVCGAYLAAERRMLGGRLGFPLDDAWIHLQFARQLAAGSGLAYQGETLVAGSTSPLWTALLAVGATLGLPLAWAKLCGLAAYALTVLATASLGRELGLGRGSRLLAAGLVASTGWLVWSALSGMETLLFAALTLAGLVRHLHERRRAASVPASLALLGLAVLARPEGALLLALAIGDRLVKRRRREGRLVLGAPPAGTSRPLLAGLAIVGLVVLPTLLFHRLVGDSFLPTTFASKAGGARDGLPDLRYWTAAGGIVLASQPVAALFAGGGAARLLRRLGSATDRGLAVVLWPFALPLAYACLSPDHGVLLLGNFGRYLFPLLPFVALLAVVALEPLYRAMPRLELAGRRLSWAPLGALLLLTPQLASLAAGRDRYLQTVGNVEESDVRAARWLADRLPADALLAVQDVGAVKYHLPNPVLDLAGIVEPAVAGLLHAADGTYWEERLLAYLAARRPDYLLVFPTSYPYLVGLPGMRQVERFAVRANVTMAGDELVLFATPWNDAPLAPSPVGPP